MDLKPIEPVDSSTNAIGIFLAILAIIVFAAWLAKERPYHGD